MLKSLILFLGAVQFASANSSFVQPNNQLSLKLFQSVYEAKPNESQIISPIGLSTVTAMVADTLANDELKAELNAALGFDKERWNAMTQHTWLSTALNEDSEGFQLNFQNAFFSNVPLSDYALESFKAEKAVVQFAEQDAEKTINAWSKKASKELIPEIVKQKEISKLHWLALNAVTLNATWEGGKFDSPKGTQPFLAEDGSEKSQVGYMMSPAKMPIQRIDMQDYHAYEIPYQANRAGEPKAVMIVFHPKTTNSKEVQEAFYTGEQVTPKLVPLKKVVQQMVDGGLDQVTGLFNQARAGAMSLEQVKALNYTDRFELMLPKFSAEATYKTKQLKSVFAANGLGGLFGRLDMTDALPWRASEATQRDWAKMKVALLKQKAKIEVSEEGTKAAAVSALGGYPESCPPQRYAVDSPFAYVIKDNVTGLILFTGTYTGK